MVKRNRGYWLRLSGFFVITLVLALAALPRVLGGLTVLGLMYAPCAGGEPNPTDYGYAWEDVVISAGPEERFRAYFIAGNNGATIIIPPAVTHRRGSRWPETLLLLEHGYSVLTFESRRCAGMGPFTLGYREIDQVGAVLAYLHERPDVDPERVGIYGFSSAGATAIMAAARLPGLKAVVAEGGYGDFVANSLGRPQERGLAGYFEQGYIAAFPPVYRWVTGLNIEILSPVSVINEIAPRPILLIYGSREVSLAGGRQQLAAAGDNAHLWIVEGAGHGNYLAVAPEAYEAQVIGFFDAALGP